MDLENVAWEMIPRLIQMKGRIIDDHDSIIGGTYLNLYL